ncbi:MAG TPA: TonB-dependent receptor [Steroidobacteraceae bacterium]|nr:TonB-dependent receptor [Steroidobacteraceae bacterium]
MLVLRCSVPKYALPALCLLAQAAMAHAQTAATSGGESGASGGNDSSALKEVVISTTIETYHEGVSTMASKLPMDSRDLASSLSILNQSAIRDREAVTLTDLVGYVTGVTQSQNSINGFSFRGFTNTGSYTQNIEFDGLQGATLKKMSVSAADVDAIEFLKGPNSVLYGQMNPGGLLNIITKSPLEVARYSVRTSLGVYAGDYSSGAPLNEDVTVDATGPVFGSGHLLYRMIVDGSSQPSSRINDHDSALSIYPSLTYKWSDATYFTVKAEDSHLQQQQDDGLIPIFTGSTIMVPVGGKLTPTAAYGPNAAWYTAPLNTIYQNNSDWAKDYGSAISTFFGTEIDNWTVRFQSRSVWHVDQVNEWTINNANVYSPKSTYAVATSVLRRQYNDVRNGHRYNYADLNAYHQFGPDMFSNTVLLGLSAGAEGFFNSRLAFGPNSTVAQAITLIDPTLNEYGYLARGTGATAAQVRQSAFGQYLSDQIRIGDLFNISLGVRHDLLRTHGLNTLLPASTIFWHQIDPVTKQAGIVYHVIPAISLYGSYSQSVKPQTTIAYDQYGNSNFPPEGGEQYEGGLKFENARRNLNATLAIYRINRTNVVVPSGTNFTIPTGSAIAGQAISRLDGEQTSKGVETEFQWQPLPYWQLQGGYAYSHAYIAQSDTNPFSVGKDLVNAPRNSANFWTRYNIPRGRLLGLGFGLGAEYVGTQWAGDPTTALYYQLRAWTRLDGAVYYRFGRRYDFALNIHNLLDKRYIMSSQSALSLNPGEQRLVTFSFEVRF